MGENSFKYVSTKTKIEAYKFIKSTKEKGLNATECNIMAKERFGISTTTVREACIRLSKVANADKNVLLLLICDSFDECEISENATNNALLIYEKYAQLYNMSKYKNTSKYVPQKEMPDFIEFVKNSNVAMGSNSMIVIDDVKSKLKNQQCEENFEEKTETEKKSTEEQEELYGFIDDTCEKEEAVTILTTLSRFEAKRNLEKAVFYLKKAIGIVFEAEKGWPAHQLLDIVFIAESVIDGLMEEQENY